MKKFVSCFYVNHSKTTNVLSNVGINVGSNVGISIKSSARRMKFDAKKGRNISGVEVSG